MRPDAFDALVARLAHSLAEVRWAAGTDALVGAVVGPDDVDLHVRVSEGDVHVAQLLCGFDAPPQWDVLGVVARGRSRPLDDADAPQRPVVVVHLQTRSGRSHSLLRPVHGPAEVMADGAMGIVADACRRGLGLPTDPPTVSPLVWWADRWLAALAAEPVARLPGDEATLVATFPGGAPFGPGIGLRALGEHGRLLETSCPWPLLRCAAAAGVIDVAGIAAPVAEWMDDGMFSRWALSEQPTCATSLLILQTRLPAALTGGLERLLQRWGVLPARRSGAGGRRRAAP